MYFCQVFPQPLTEDFNLVVMMKKLTDAWNCRSDEIIWSIGQKKMADGIESEMDRVMHLEDATM